MAGYYKRMNEQLHGSKWEPIEADEEPMVHAHRGVFFVSHKVRLPVTADQDWQTTEVRTGMLLRHLQETRDEAVSATKQVLDELSAPGRLIEDMAKTHGLSPTFALDESSPDDKSPYEGDD